MKKNQAFEILAKARDPHDARVIIENTNNFSFIKVCYIAHALKRGVPVAKIIHQKWFYGLKFYTNRHTLDPRPDTETLVAAVITDCGKESAPKILDLGTGTGCIISSLVKNIYGATGVGADISRGAIRVARRNIKSLDLSDKVQIVRKDFSKPKAFSEQFDIIVSNPPYIAHGDTRVNIGAMYDPKIALYANDNGLFAYKVIAQNAKNWLKPLGKIYLEIGEGQTKSVKEIFANEGWSFERTEKDLSGIERVLVFHLGNSALSNPDFSE